MGIDETSDLILTKKQGELLAQCLSDNKVVFMRNHGVVVVGKNIEETVGAAVFLERASKYQIISMLVGKYVCSSEKEVENRLKQHFCPNNFKSLFCYLQRKNE